VRSEVRVGPQYKCPLLLSDFIKIIFSADFGGGKKYLLKISNFMKICLVGVALFRADRQTDMTMLIVAIRNFANVPKNERGVGN